MLLSISAVLYLKNVPEALILGLPQVRSAHATKETHSVYQSETVLVFIFPRFWHNCLRFLPPPHYSDCKCSYFPCVIAFTAAAASIFSRNNNPQPSYYLSLLCIGISLKPHPIPHGRRLKIVFFHLHWVGNGVRCVHVFWSRKVFVKPTAQATERKSSDSFSGGGAVMQLLATGRSSEHTAAGWTLVSK